jgi:Na+-transporting NADH:ubiquinone oxidoreductase subunit A
MIKISKGLDIPIVGAPMQSITDGPKVTKVALIGADYNGMKPTMKVQVGDEVKCGQLLFEDKKVPGVLFTAPAGGKIVEINRGARRAFQSIVIEVSDNEQFVDFGAEAPENLASLGVEKTRAKLINSGLWTSFRTRPFSKSPAVDSLPNSIFVTAIDTNPLAGNPEIVIKQSEMDFLHGLNVLSNLTETSVHLCKQSGAVLPQSDNGKVKVHEFKGKHPAGLAGTHIHFIDPVGPNKTVWTIGYQDVIAIGKLFSTGKYSAERVVSLAGPMCREAKLYKTRVGANLSELKAGKMQDGQVRVISGSILDGRTAQGPFDYLGKFHNQVSAIADEAPREFLGWLSPGAKKFSVGRTFISSLLGGQFSFNTALNGSQRTMIPIGLYEKVMPLDILPTQLLRAIDVQDMDDAQALGALELDEEDLALCTFVDPSKVDYGVRLRELLTTIEKEG